MVAHCEVVLEPEGWQHHSVTYGERQSKFVDLFLYLRLDVHRGLYVRHVGHRSPRRHGGRGVARDGRVRVVHLIQLVLKYSNNNVQSAVVVTKGSDIKHACTHNYAEHIDYSITDSD